MRVVFRQQGGILCPRQAHGAGWQKLCIVCKELQCEEPSDSPNFIHIGGKSRREVQKCP